MSFCFFIIIFSSLFNSVVFVELLVASLLCIVLLVHHFMKMSTKVMLKYLKNECYDLEGVVEFSIFLHNNKESLLEECIFRYGKFFAHQYVEGKVCVVTCEGEVSRVCFKRLTDLLHRRRKIGKRVCKHEVRNVRVSSKMHCFVNKCNFNHEEMKCYSKIYQGCKFKGSIGYGYPLPGRRSLLSRKLGKVEELSIFFDDNKEAHLLEECRSRYAKFFGHQYVEHKLCVVTRDREPSRVPFKD